MRLQICLNLESVCNTVSTFADGRPMKPAPALARANRFILRSELIVLLSNLRGVGNVHGSRSEWTPSLDECAVLIRAT